MAKKLWGGRFSKDTDALVDKMNASIDFDKRLYHQDIAGSIAHATMLGEQGILSQDDVKAIVDGLKGIEQDIEAGKIHFTRENEDIHMNIEAILTERIGEAGKRLHTGRSRNDQVAVDFRQYVKEEIPEIIDDLKSFERVLTKKARLHTKTVMPGYTHLQRAQPITYAHYLMAYANMFRRDILRLQDCESRLDECPLGAGALATTTYPIDRARTAELLGFARPMSNSLDAVSDRDYALELLSDLSILMMHLSRMAEETVLWSSWEFKFIELDDAYSTGSSIMPQKKNPDVAELARGKTGRVYGDLMALLTTMKGLPLAYNKDMQEDKEPVFDAVDTVELCLPVFTAMIDTAKVNVEQMHAAAKGGFINATDVADYLVKKGLPFREAHAVSGHLVAKCIDEGKTLDELSLDEFRAASPLFEGDIYQAIDLTTCVNGRNVTGGPSEASVLKQIEEIEELTS